MLSLICSLQFVVLFIYYLSFRNTPSILVKPTLQKLVFFREYLLLTVIPYIYYVYDDKYLSHYIFSSLDGNVYFLYATLFAFVFIVNFLLTYRFCEPVIRKSLSCFNPGISYGRLFFILRIGLIFSAAYLFIVTFIFDASIVGLLKYRSSELIAMRAKLGHGGGFLTFNKIVLKQWIPMLSYIYFYLYFSNNVNMRRFDKCFMLLSLILGVISSIWYFEKAVIGFYLFGVIGVYVYSGRRLKKRVALVLPVIVLALTASMYVLTYQDKIIGTQYLSDILLHRTLSQSTGSVMAIHYFDSHDFFYFSGVSNLLASVSGDEFQSPYAAIIDYYVPEFSETSGAMSSFVTGEAFGLFGLVGVLLSGFIVGLYYSFFEATKSSNFLAIIFVGLYGLYFSHFYVASSFYTFLWPVGIVYSISPFVCLALLSVSPCRCHKNIEKCVP